MVIIKRYPNRKLYDTESKQYITLDGIAELVRSGQEIQVIDHTSGEDMTTLTLTQIILEQEKKHGGRLSHSTLSGIIRSSGDALQRAVGSSVTLWRQIDDEIRQRVQTMVNKGQLSEKEGQNLLEQLLSQSPIFSRASKLSDEKIEKILSQQQIPTFEDYQRLSAQLEELSSRLDDLSETSSQPQIEEDHPNET